MCKTLLPNHDCQHYGTEFTTCEAIFAFHSSECEGLHTEIRLCKRKYCCTLKCCLDSIARHVANVSELKRNLSGLSKPALSEAIQRAEQELDTDRKRHEEVCQWMEREEERFVRWTYREEHEIFARPDWERNTWPDYHRLNYEAIFDETQLSLGEGAAKKVVDTRQRNDSVVEEA